MSEPVKQQTAREENRAEKEETARDVREWNMRASMCPVCGNAMFLLNGFYRCPACGYKESCCYL